MEFVKCQYTDSADMKLGEERTNKCRILILELALLATLMSLIWTLEKQGWESGN